MTSHYEGVLPLMVFLHQQTSVFAHVHAYAHACVMLRNLSLSEFPTNLSNNI